MGISVSHEVKLLLVRAISRCVLLPTPSVGADWQALVRSTRVSWLRSRECLFEG